ncbi:hypothetical protein LTR08_002247 [Meristemomyces frigidus]|nr:hypothetical protein LTR08_002247 [Meristemomyces frigidus]
MQTLYHAPCTHWGVKPTLVGPPCIRAATQSGHSAGCDDTTDIGVDTVDTLCPACTRKFHQLLTPQFGTPSALHTPPSSCVYSAAVCSVDADAGAAGEWSSSWCDSVSAAELALAEFRGVGG